MPDPEWRRRRPTPTEVNDHAEAHTFVRYAKDDPDEDYVMPAFGLWAHRDPKARIPSDGYPLIVLLRHLGNGRIECLTREGEYEMPTGGEWCPMGVAIALVAWPGGARGRRATS